MSRMHSPRTQCCCCAGNIFFMLFGILMLSTGTCLVLNYGQLDVDTGGLPPEWQNEEGKKIVGIILICCGFVSMGISALMGALYFTVCSRPKPPLNAISPRILHGVKTPRDGVRTPRDGVKTSRDGIKTSRDGIKTSRDGKPLPKLREDPSVKTAASNYSVAANQPKHGKHQKRRKKRNMHNLNLKQGMYASRLATHSEYDEVRGFMKEDVEMTDSLMSVDSSHTGSSEARKTSVEADVKPSVIISVTSLPGVEGCVPDPQPAFLGRPVTQIIRSYAQSPHPTHVTHSEENIPSTSKEFACASVNLEPSASTPGMSETTDI